ncbi:MAG: tetratricopeptide repeat protein [Candidatus Obscuribacterales bacterium]|nr:tetratricopeptide repeat protein [Candidatus Obscuribacterales bacterium]
MQCPGCGLYHPARYEQCVSCGRSFTGQDDAVATEPKPPGAFKNQRKVQTPVKQEELDESDEEEDAEEIEDDEDLPKRNRPKKKGGLPLGLGITIAAGILLASAGGTYFFLSRPPESDRLLSEGQKELANGQYAFAQKTLEQAMALKPNDPTILMTLARAYVGTDQVERAWSCISQATQSGKGIASDPQLASDLAKFYVQRNQYARAADLLRPLAEANVPHKKTELADLNALWGDACFNRGDTAQALKCWEEIKSLGEGSRFNECDTRLATIYQKMSNDMLAKDNIEGALTSLSNLNNIAPSPQSYEKTSDLYAKTGKLDLAIDQLRRAIKLGNGSHDLNRKLAGLLAKRGKELLDKGDAETGYAYLQQAQGLDSRVKVPTVALRGIHLDVDNAAGGIRCQGEAWNPGPASVAYLHVKTELYDTKTSQVLWSREQRVVDEFVPPLGANETRAFDISGPGAPREDGSVELRVYLDGSLYKSYPIGTASNSPDSAEPEMPRPAPDRTQQAPPPPPQQPAQPPPVAPPSRPIEQTPLPNSGGLTPEERTMRDLE